MKERQFIHVTETRVLFGANVHRDVGLEVERLGASRALVVTDQVLATTTDVVTRVQEALGARCAGVFSDVEPDSSVEIVERAAARARELKCDAIVSVGGGSSIDTAKGAAIVATLGGSLLDHQGFQSLGKKLIPHVAIPTTAGTGSEVTYVAVIRDVARQCKLLFGDYFLQPDVAMLDPTLTMGLPAKLTAATGMDALTHAIEAIHSLEWQPFSDALALHAMALIRKILPRAVYQGATDVDARGQMLCAATIAGYAFSNAQVGVVHALAHSVGALHRVHHGTANAILLPHGIRFNAKSCKDRYQLCVDAFSGHHVDADDAPEALAQAVADFVRALGLPTTLKEVGVTEDSLPAIAELALSDGAIVYNPRPVMEAEELLPVLRSAFLVSC